MSGTWGLAQFTRGGGDPETGILVDGVIHAAPATIAKLGVLELCSDWDAVTPVLRGLDPTAGEPIADASLLAPITYPRKVICAGANYYSHAAEMGTARPDPTAPPFFFLKPPTTTVVSHGSVVPYPAGHGVNLDWEAELAVVISRPARHLNAEQAARHIAGYTVANDLSARGAFPRQNAVMAPFAFDWLGHKGQDGFCPLGPAIVPAWLLPDPQNLILSLTVNGVGKQYSSTADMVVGVHELVAAASRLMTLEPGDVILTGTPAGVGMPNDEFLSPGDVVTAGVEGIGDLTVTIGAPISDQRQLR